MDSAWVVAIATFLLAIVAGWQAFETRRTIRRTIAVQALAALQATDNSAVRQWARNELMKRLKGFDITKPPPGFFKDV